VVIVCSLAGALIGPPVVVDHPVIYTPLLREKSWGRHEGLGYDEIVKMERQGYETFDQWMALLGGERVEAFRRRILDFFTGTLLKESANEVLVVTHLGVINVILSHLQGRTLEAAFQDTFGYGCFVSLELPSTIGRIECVK